MVQKALTAASNLNTNYIPRNKKSLTKLLEENSASTVLVIGHEQVVLRFGTEKFYFHPSLAKLRTLAVQKGEKDYMLEAMNLKGGSSLLDCTLGLGADAIVASFVIGEAGKIVGLESSLALSYVVKEGLKWYCDQDEELNQAMRRIEVINAYHEDFLKEQPTKSFDVVYFDPMFRYPRKDSDAIGAIRELANPEQISLSSIYEAKRVARKRIVLKERNNSNEFLRLGFKIVIGGKYSPISFGIIEVDKEC